MKSSKQSYALAESCAIRLRAENNPQWYLCTSAPSVHRQTVVISRTSPVWEPQQCTGLWTVAHIMSEANNLIDAAIMTKCNVPLQRVDGRRLDRTDGLYHFVRASSLTIHLRQSGLLHIQSNLLIRQDAICPQPKCCIQVLL